MTEEQIIEERNLEEFDAAMVEAGYHKPERHSITGELLYERDADRYMGWQAARQSNQRNEAVACYTKTYGLVMLKAGLLRDLPNNTLLYTYSPPTYAVKEALEQAAKICEFDIYQQSTAGQDVSAHIAKAIRNLIQQPESEGK